MLLWVVSSYYVETDGWYHNLSYNLTYSTSVSWVTIKENVITCNNVCKRKEFVKKLVICSLNWAPMTVLWWRSIDMCYSPSLSLSLSLSLSIYLSIYLSLSLSLSLYLNLSISIYLYFSLFLSPLSLPLPLSFSFFSLCLLSWQVSESHTKREQSKKNVLSERKHANQRRLLESAAATALGWAY